MTQALKTLQTITVDYSIFEQDQVLTADQLNSVSDYLNDQTRLMRVNLLGVGVISGLRGSVQGNTVKVSQGIGLTTDGDLLFYAQDQVFDRFRIYNDNSVFQYEYAPFFVNGVMIDTYELIAQGTTDDRTPIFLLQDFNTQTQKNLDDMVAVLLMESYVNDPDICTGTDCDNLGQDCRNTPRLLLIDQAAVNLALKPAIATPSAAYRKLSKIDIDRPRIPASLQSLNELTQIYRNTCSKIYSKLLVELDKIYPVCAVFLNGGSELIGGGSVATAVATVSTGAVTAVTLTSGTGYTAPPTVVISGGGGTGAIATATLVPSSVATLNLISGGSGYTIAPTVTISGGGGSGAMAIATLANRSVNSISVTAGGTGYTAPPTVTLNGGGGSGATATAILSGRAIASLNLTASGAGYTTAPTVTLSGGGGATATATLAAGAVGNINITTGGSGYTSTPTVTLTGGGGTGATATANLGTASIASITRTNGGSGYTSVPTVTITGGGGSGAQATATIAAGAVTAINVTVSGSGYTSAPTVTISGGGGSGATATAVLSGRAIASITVTVGGTGYTSAPTVGLSGGSGSGATATAVLSGRAIASLNLTAPGTGYTSAPSVSFTGGGGSGAAASAILVPGSVSSILVTAGGSGYLSAPSVSLTGGGGVGATATAVLAPGVVNGITVTAGGSGYTSTPTVTITGEGGSGADAMAVLTPTAVSNVSITASGSGYTSIPTVTLIGGGGIGATAIARISAGAVSAIALTSGTGYVSAPTIRFTGNGVGATATATIVAGSVTAITLISGGSGYTMAPTVTFTGGAPVPVAPVSVGTWRTKLSEINARSNLGIQYYYDFLKDVSETFNQFRELLFGDTTWRCPDLNAFPKHLLLGNLKPGPDTDQNRIVFHPSPLVSRTADALDQARFLIQKMDLLIKTFQVPTSATSVPIRITPSVFEDEPLESRAIPYYYPFNAAQPLHRYWNYQLHQRGMDAHAYDAGLYSPAGTTAKPFDYQIGAASFFRIEGHLGQKLDTALNTITQIIQTQNLPLSVLAVKLESANQPGGLPFKDLLALYPGLEHFGGAVRGGMFVLLADASNDAIVADFMVPALPVQTGGDSLCTLQLKPSDNLAAALSTIAPGQDAHICFAAGTYTLPGRIALQNKGHLTLNGSGRGTRILAPALETAIEFVNCKSVAIRDCAFDSGANQTGTPSGFANNLEDLKGVLTFINCPIVELENLALRCAHQGVRSSSCVTVRQDLAVANSQTRIRHCDLQVGYQQIGILLINVERSQIEDNQIQVDRTNGLATLTALSNLSNYRLRLLPRLVANIYLGSKRPGDRAGGVKGTGATSTRYDEAGVQLTYAGQSIRFKSDLSTAIWQTLIGSQNPFVQTRQDLKNAIEQLARQILLNDAFRVARPAFDNWYKTLNAQSSIIASQGIAVVGGRMQEVRIVNNTIRGFLQGIHLGMRRFNRAGSVWLTENRIEVEAPLDQIRERHGIYVSSCDSLIIENNYLVATRKPPMTIEGIRIAGRLGRMVIIRHNHLAGFNPVGIYLSPMDTYGSEKMQWLVADNIAVSAVTAVRVVSNRPGAEGTQITSKVQNTNNFQ